MGHSRQLRRKVKRAMVNNTIDADKTNKIIDAYIDAPAQKQEMYNSALADMVLIFAGYQRIHNKYGKKRITQEIEKFVDFCNNVHAGRLTKQEIIDMLKEETGYDFNTHAGELELLVKELHKQ